jgi:flagellar biosynthesis protein FlhA
MRVEPLELEVAYDLVELVDPSVGGDLLDRVRSLRRKMALELGIVLPPVRTRDNLDLPLHTYAVRVHGVEVGRGEAPSGAVLAIGDDLAALPGVVTREPVFGLPAKWIPVELQQQAELMGCTVVDRASVITTHLAEVVRTSASRLLGARTSRSSSTWSAPPTPPSWTS